LDSSVTPTSALPTAAPRAPRWPLWLALIALLATTLALLVAWDTQVRVRALERELVQRQESSQRDAAEARAAARTAQDMAKEATARSAMLEARIAEAAMQRSQVEELLQSVARSRDENVVADVEAAITGSAEPLVGTLKQAEERLARYNQPRLERVRRAVARDLERVKAQGAVDISTLTARLDEAVRLVDELPLIAVAPPQDVRAKPAPATPPKRGAGSASAVAAPAAAASAAPAGDDGWRSRALAWWRSSTGQAGEELRALVRVTRIERPESALIAPDQQFFVRENLKLRLLNARLALFARQFEIAQADLRDASAMVERYFDRSSKRVIAASEVLRQVGLQARQGPLPRPDETLAALATAAAGR
jgi:uroporphyrin-3 C-methyltransferase